MILGIDLGTTHSLVTYYNNGKSQHIKNSLGNVLTPSVISVDDNNTILIGESAKHRLITHSEDTVSEFKRFMGTKKSFRLGINTFDATDLSSMILKTLKSDAENLHQQTIDEVFISVPAYFNNLQREATKLAAKLAGFKTINLLNEPTAAALAFGVNGNKEAEGHYIVLDMGGGTFDVSLLEVFNGIFEIHASAGDNYLGGKDFTMAIVSNIIDANKLVQEELSPKEKSKLYKAAELIKYELSEKTVSTIPLEIANLKIEYQLDQRKFAQISHDLLQRIKHPIWRVLSDSGLSVDEINGVILVGGATRMELFRSMVGQMFKRIPRNDYHPDEAVAMGCAIYAGMAEKNNAIRDIILTDICPYTLGVAVKGSGADLEFLPLIERNSTIPVSETRPLSPSHPNQKQVTIDVYQGESFNPKNNLYLGKLEVNLPDDPKKRDFLLTYTYDIDGTLEVEVVIPAVNKKYKTHIKDGQELTDESIASRFKRLAHLKILPREQQRNRELLSRLERLFEETRGDIREDFAVLLRHFIGALDTYNTKKIDKAYEEIKNRLNQSFSIYL